MCLHQACTSLYVVSVIINIESPLQPLIFEKNVRVNDVIYSICDFYNSLTTRGSRTADKPRQLYMIYYLLPELISFLYENNSSCSVFSGINEHNSSQNKVAGNGATNTATNTALLETKLNLHCQMRTEDVKLNIGYMAPFIPIPWLGEDKLTSFWQQGYSHSMTYDLNAKEELDPLERFQR